MRRLFPSASHIVSVAKVKGEVFSDDDGEYGAGFCLEKVVKEWKADKAANPFDNVVVLVVRFYGGENLGYKRFQHYKTTTISALEKWCLEDTCKVKEI